MEPLSVKIILMKMAAVSGMHDDSKASTLKEFVS